MDMFKTYIITKHVHQVFEKFQEMHGSDDTDYVVWQMAFFLCHDMKTIIVNEEDKTFNTTEVTFKNDNFDAIRDIQHGLTITHTTTLAMLKDNATICLNRFKRDFLSDHSSENLVRLAFAISIRLAEKIIQKIENQKIDPSRKLLMLFNNTKKHKSGDKYVPSESYYSLDVYKADKVDDEYKVTSLSFKFIETFKSKSEQTINFCYVDDDSQHK